MHWHFWLDKPRDVFCMKLAKIFVCLYILTILDVYYGPGDFPRLSRFMNPPSSNDPLLRWGPDHPSGELFRDPPPATTEAECRRAKDLRFAAQRDNASCDWSYFSRNLDCRNCRIEFNWWVRHTGTPSCQETALLCFFYKGRDTVMPQNHSGKRIPSCEETTSW